jgi:hypothetical protein
MLFTIHMATLIAIACSKLQKACHLMTLIALSSTLGRNGASFAHAPHVLLLPCANLLSPQLIHPCLTILLFAMVRACT